MHKLHCILALTFALSPLATASALAIGNNLVTDGNFATRNFSSDYSGHTYPTKKPVNGTGPGYFELGSNPSKDNSSWSGSAYTGAGQQFLLVDGSTTGSTDSGASPQLDGTARVWFQSVSVKAGMTYDLSAYAEAFDSANYSDLEFTVGGKHGTQVGSDLLLGPVDVWKDLNAVWTAPKTETVSFAIVDKQTASHGNDFGLDSISIRAVPEAGTVVTFVMLMMGGLLVLRKRGSAQANA